MRAKTGRSTLPGAVPTVVQLEEELKRETYRKQYGRVLRSTIYILITVAAVAVLSPPSGSRCCKFMARP